MHRVARLALTEYVIRRDEPAIRRVIVKTVICCVIFFVYFGLVVYLLFVVNQLIAIALTGLALFYI